MTLMRMHLVSLPLNLPSWRSMNTTMKGYFGNQYQHRRKYLLSSLADGYSLPLYIQSISPSYLPVGLEVREFEIERPNTFKLFIDRCYRIFLPAAKHIYSKNEQLPLDIQKSH